MKGIEKGFLKRRLESGNSRQFILAMLAAVLLAHFVLAVSTKDTQPIANVVSLSCGGVTSTTATPGVNETVVVPVGHNNGSLSVTAKTTGKPLWSGVASSSGATATVSTASSGTYNVTATCGNTVGLTVQVVGVSGLTARRKGSDGSFGPTAMIAVGGKNSDVHKAEIRIQLTPKPLKQLNMTVPASLSGASAHKDTDVAAVLTCGNSTITGSSSGTITIGEMDLATGCATAELTSSNVGQTCTVSIGGKSVDVVMNWDISGMFNFVYNDKAIYLADFLPYVENKVSFYPTLDEMAGHDEDKDGKAGEGAIDGHDIKFYVTKVTFDYWSFDIEKWEYIDKGGVVEQDVVAGANPTLRFGVRLDELIDVKDVTETISGKYVNRQTVSDYYTITGNVIKCITVKGYKFVVYDEEVYVCE